MKLSITSTPFITEIDGVPVRLWEGRTERGVACKVFIHRVAVAAGEDVAEFEAELLQKVPPEKPISFAPARIL